RPSAASGAGECVQRDDGAGAFRSCAVHPGPAGGDSGARGRDTLQAARQGPRQQALIPLPCGCCGLTAPAGRSMSRAMDTLSRLEQTIARRRASAASESYVAQLHARGLPVIARKLGEEAVEAVIAALSGEREELVGEA